MEAHQKARSCSFDKLSNTAPKSQAVNFPANDKNQHQ
jgi:hypothetical protein